MSEPLSIGIIGAGKVAQAAHIPAFLKAPGARVAAVADLRRPLAEAVAGHFGILQSYGSPEELLEADGIDAVVVVLPRPAMGPVTLQCLEAGRHVLAEKPMCGSLDQARRLVAAAEVAGRRYVVGYMKRFDPGVVWAKTMMDRLLADGSLGGLLFARLHCYQGDDGMGQYQPLSAEGGGEGPEWPMAPDWLDEEWGVPYHVYLNRYSHDVNLLRHLLPGTPKVAGFRYTELFSQVALLDMDGVSVTLETGFNHFHGWDEVLEIYFERGRLSITFPPPFDRSSTARVHVVRAGSDTASPTEEVPSFEPDWAFERQAAAFVTDVRAGHASVAEAADALGDMALIEDIWRNVEKTRPQESGNE